MKRLVHLILLVCLAHITCAGQTNFNSYYKTGFNNVLSCNALTTPDSGCVFVNYITDSATHRQDFGLIRLDKNGNEVVKKSFNMFNYDYAAFLNGEKQFIEATKSSYFITGGINIGSDYGLIINKINRKTLDTIKTAVYGVSPYIGSSMNSFIKLNENKYFLIGSNGNSVDVWPSILELDSNLNLVTTKNLNNPTGFAINNAIYNPVSKKILMAGPSPLLNGPWTNNQPITLMHTDTLGNVLEAIVLSSQTYPNSLVQVYYSAFDNSYVLISAKQTSTYNTYAMQALSISKVDANSLMPIWQKTYGDAMVITALVDAVIENDGSIVASGGYAPYDPLPLTNEDNRGVILKVDKDGNLMWFREYNNLITGSTPHQYWESFYGIDKTKEGGYIVCGNVMNQPKAKAWAVKTDSVGCVTGGCPSTSVSQSSFAVTVTTVAVNSATNISGVNERMTNSERVKIYPNPVKDILTIEILQNGKNLEVRIVDIYGREVKRGIKNQEPRLQLDLSGLNPGIYFVTVNSEGKLIYKSKLIKE